MQCATHPRVETELRCATCGVPICPDCLVQTPVGMKCREHGIGPLPPKYQVSALGYAAAVPLGLLLSAVAAGLVLWLPFPFLLAFVFSAPLGGAIAEAISYASGRKRGPRLAAVSAATVALGSLGGPLLVRVLQAGGPPGLADLQVGLFLSPAVLVFGGLAAATAYWRVR